MGLPHVSPGQPQDRSAWRANQIADAINWTQAQQLETSYDRLRGNAEPDHVKVQNGTCGDYSRYDVVQLDSPITLPSEDEATWASGPIAFRGITPDETGGRIAILDGPCASCSSTRGVVSGLARTQVNISDTSHRWATPIAGSRRLESTSDPTAPCEIVWPPAEQSATGEQFAIVRISNAGSGTSVSTPTTTTLTAESPCSGRCKWFWSSATASWSLHDDGCGQASTTTSAEPTTTTGDPTSSTTSTTTTTCCPFAERWTPSSTTTTTAGCQCLHPVACGAYEGECTYTSCSDATNQPPVCGSTTTSAAPTTTTCDCDTTTTAAPDTQCQDGCDWVGMPDGGWHWAKTSDGCHGGCPCPPPSANPYCATAHTNCETTTPTPTTVPPPCTGNCTFWWVPALNGWVLTAINCSTYSGCGCAVPTQEGNACAPTIVPCAVPAGSDPTTTTAAPCADCYTSATTSTTTTTPACGGNCRWQWSTGSGSWNLVGNNCEAECPCMQPAYDGVADCETSFTPCVGTTTTSTTTTTGTTTSTSSSSTSSTSSTSSSSTSSTSSTSTTEPCSGTCVWECTAEGDPGSWALVSDGCTGADPCECSDRNACIGCLPCSSIGQIANTPCGNYPPPTSTSTTSTTEGDPPTSSSTSTTVTS